MVTGASGGIGECYARRLAEAGRDLVVVARDRARLEMLGKELDERYGTVVQVLAADLTLAAELATVEARLADEQHPIDTLVNNAGFGSYGEFSSLDIDGETREIQLNVVALVRLTHAALGPMVRRGSGEILNVSSVASYQPTPLMATYGATKAFVTSFTQSVHEETRGTGVRVTVQCPGYTETGFGAAAGANTTNIPRQMWQTADEVAVSGLEDLAKGVAVSVPGWKNKALVGVTSVLPTGVTRRVAGLLTK
jgi:uncharacterized protein